jgi:hypothetical protein
MLSEKSPTRGSVDQCAFTAVSAVADDEERALRSAIAPSTRLVRGSCSMSDEKAPIRDRTRAGEWLVTHKQAAEAGLHRELALECDQLPTRAPLSIKE